MSNYNLQDLRVLAIKNNIPHWHEYDKEALQLQLQQRGVITVPTPEQKESTQEKKPVIKRTVSNKRKQPDNTINQAVIASIQSKTSIVSAPNTPSAPKLRLSQKFLKSDVKRAVASCQDPIILLQCFNLLTKQ
jgi:hypothetical protein